IVTFQIVRVLLDVRGYFIEMSQHLFSLLYSGNVDRYVWRRWRDLLRTLDEVDTLVGFPCVDIFEAKGPHYFRSIWCKRVCPLKRFDRLCSQSILAQRR